MVDEPTFSNVIKLGDWGGEICVLVCVLKRVGFKLAKSSASKVSSKSVWISVLYGQIIIQFEGCPLGKVIQNYMFKVKNGTLERTWQLKYNYY